MKKFWLVWRANGQSPSTMHHTENKALAEADRLAEKNVGIKFYVMEATLCVEAKAVITTHNMEKEFDPEEWSKSGGGKE